FVANPDAKRLESTMTTVGQRVRAIMPDGNDIIGTAVGLGATGSLLIQGETDPEVLAADIVHLRPACANGSQFEEGHAFTLCDWRAPAGAHSSAPISADQACL